MCQPKASAQKVIKSTQKAFANKRTASGLKAKVTQFAFCRIRMRGRNVKVQKTASATALLQSQTDQSPVALVRKMTLLMTVADLTTRMGKLFISIAINAVSSINFDGAKCRVKNSPTWQSRGLIIIDARSAYLKLERVTQEALGTRFARPYMQIVHILRDYAVDLFNAQGPTNIP